MKKNLKAKLRLDRETVRTLKAAALTRVAGGGTGGCSQWCGDTGGPCSGTCSVWEGSVCQCNVSETWCGQPCPK